MPGFHIKTVSATFTKGLICQRVFERNTETRNWNMKERHFFRFKISFVEIALSGENCWIPSNPNEILPFFP